MAVFPAILATAPALILASLWVIADGFVLNQMLIEQFPSELKIEGRQTILILLAQIQNISDGVVVGQPDEWIFGSGRKIHQLAQLFGYPDLLCCGCLFPSWWPLWD